MSEQRFLNLAKFERRYREEYLPLYEKFASRLCGLLEELINKVGIPIDHIEHRVKTVESFLKKIERFKLYDDPFEQIKDCVGIRIITYYQDDVKEVIEMLKKEFDVDEDLSGDKMTELGPREFGYRAFHLKIFLSTPRVTLQEWKPYAGLPAEIQVRSVLQHAWAAIEHELAYKSQTQPSSKLLRQFARLSAKLEEADEEFIRLRNLSKRIVKEENNEMDRGEPNLPVNLDTLQEFVNHGVDLQKWEQFGVQVDMEPFPRLISRNHSTSIKILLLTLQTIGIATVAEFECLLQDFEKVAKPVRKFVDLVKSQGETVFAVPVDVLILLASFAKPHAISVSFDWGGEYSPVFIEAFREICKEQSKT